MEDPPGETDFPYHCQPHSQRDLHSIQLRLLLASTETEKKQILTSSGITIEEAIEFFGPGAAHEGLGDD